MKDIAYDLAFGGLVLLTAVVFMMIGLTVGRRWGRLDERDRRNQRAQLTVTRIAGEVGQLARHRQEEPVSTSRSDSVAPSARPAQPAISAWADAPTLQRGLDETWPVEYGPGLGDPRANPAELAVSDDGAPTSGARDPWLRRDNRPHGQPGMHTKPAQTRPQRQP